jgi:hypothetical protein
MAAPRPPTFLEQAQTSPNPPSVQLELLELSKLN